MGLSSKSLRRPIWEHNSRVRGPKTVGVQDLEEQMKKTLKPGILMRRRAPNPHYKDPPVESRAPVSISKLFATDREWVQEMCYGPLLILKKVGSSSIILLLYVDDMLVAGSDMAEIKKLKRQLSQEFKMKDLGPTKQILGMSIIIDRTKGTLRLSQEKYIRKVLEKFNMKDAGLIMAKVPYASAVGSVICTMVCTRPNIAHAVGVVSRFMSNLGREHWEAVKWLLRYLKGTSKATLCFSRKEVVLEGFSDSNYGGCLDSGKSTTGYVFTVGGIAVSWMYRIQKCVAMSTTEAEYMAIAEAGKELRIDALAQLQLAFEITDEQRLVSYQRERRWLVAAAGGGCLQRRAVVVCSGGRWLVAVAGGGWLQRRLQEGGGFVAPVWRGQYKEKESSKDTATRKINCPFMLVGKYSWVYNGWTLSVMCDEHNHPPAQHMEAHPYARRLTTDEYRLVEDLTRKNVEAQNILAILKEQNKDNVSTIKDIYNAQSKIRKAQKVGGTTMQNLMSLLHTQGYVHDYDTHPVTNELEALFFVHPSSFKIWRAFPHVLIIDATYKTNIYKMPFVEIVVALSYVDEQWLNKYKEMFVSAWTDQSLNFGIQNVGSDGNSGFRAVALGLGLSEDQWPRIRSDLVRELEARQRQYKYVFGTIGYEKIYSTVKFAGRWMEMPDTGLVIASAYKKVVVNLSDAGGCNTSFPLWSRPLQSDSHETIVVAHVDGNHYIRVALREGFPLPLTHPVWITYRSDIASGWEDKFGSTPGTRSRFRKPPSYAQKEKARIQLQAEEFDLMAAAADLDEIEEVNANCILMANLQQASTSGTQTDKAPVYDSDGSAEVSSVEQDGGTVDQHPATVEETRVYFESLYNNLAIEVEKVNSVNRKMKETNADLTTELARYKNQEKCFEISQEKYDKLERAAKFVRDFKSLAKEADESLAKHKALELEIERLLRAVVSQDIMSIVLNPSVVDSSNLQTKLKRTKERFENYIVKKENEYAKLWNDWYKKCKECKYDKISYDKAYNDMQQKIKRLQAQLGDQKENAHLKTTYKNLFDSISVTRTQTKIIIDSLQNKLHDTICENAKLRTQLFDKVSEQKDTTYGTSMNTKFAKQSILRKPPSSSRPKLYAVTPLPKSKAIPKIDESHALSKPVTSNSVPTPTESKVVKNDNVISLGIFRINPFKASRVDNFVPNKHVKESVRTKLITVSQPYVVTKEDVNSNRNGFSPNNIESTTRTRRPQPRYNPKNDKYVNGMKSTKKNQSANVSNVENQKKHKPKVRKPKKSFAVTTADASDKRHQQQDSTSSTSTLVTTITADGIFDLSSWQYLKDRPTVVSQGVIRRLRLGYQVKDQDSDHKMQKELQRNSQEYKAPSLKTSQEGSSIE
ncbi:retrovirus-related pol polyprotein from transposon TNT 1-94 [Tanacetum coccineum]